MVLRQLVLLLPIVHRAEAVPGVVVPRVESDRRAVGHHRLLEVLVGEVLVPAQRVRVRELGIELQRAPEEPKRRLVLLLQREAVPERAPRLRRQAVAGHALLRQVRQPRVALQVPQHGRVHLARLEPGRVHAPRALERARALRVRHHLRVRLPEQTQRVPSVALPGVQPRQRRHALGAAEHREVRRRRRQRRQQRAQRERALREPPGREQNRLGFMRIARMRTSEKGVTRDRISPGISPGGVRVGLGDVRARELLGGATRTRLAVQRLAAVVLAARRGTRAARAAAHRRRGSLRGFVRLVPPRVRGGHEPGKTRSLGVTRRAGDGRQPRAAARVRRQLFSLLRRGVREEAP